MGYCLTSSLSKGVMYRPYLCSTSVPVIGKFTESTEPAEDGLFVVLFTGDISSRRDDGCFAEIFSTSCTVLLSVR